jgi:hypothetical protein
MKKTILLCSLTGLVFGFSFSQVGINTEKPLGAFHVDGKADTTDPPTAATLADDVIVTADGKVGLGTNDPQAKLDIRATGGKGLRISDGNPEKGKIAVSDADGNLSWYTRPSPEQVSGGIILATSTTAPNLKKTNPSMTTAPVAVMISDPVKPMVLKGGKWLIQVKYTTRKTYDGSSYGVCNGGSHFYIWTLLYDATTFQVLTTVGTAQERSGFCISTPQLAHVVEIPAGEEHTISVYASTSTDSNVIVYKDGDVITGTTTAYYGAPIFRAVRLDSFNQITP